MKRVSLEQTIKEPVEVIEVSSPSHKNLIAEKIEL